MVFGSRSVCGSKAPLNSLTLQALSAIDPLAWGHSIGHLKCLANEETLSNWIPPESDIHQEILCYNVDSFLKPDEKSGVVNWWSFFLETRKYPGLCGVACAALSIFHGLLVVF